MSTNSTNGRWQLPAQDASDLVEVICRDTELLHREFDDIIAAEWPTETLQPPRAETSLTEPPSRPATPTGADRRAEIPWWPPRRPTGRQRSPPASDTTVTDEGGGDQLPKEQ